MVWQGATGGGPPGRAVESVELLRLVGVSARFFEETSLLDEVVA
jgi:hypothetical protein